MNLSEWKEKIEKAVEQLHKSIGDDEPKQFSFDIHLDMKEGSYGYHFNSPYSVMDSPTPLKQSEGGG